jgi:beta-phosphoglucomutase-like phosphatase (HAD superfamily)
MRRTTVYKQRRALGAERPPNGRPYVLLPTLPRYDAASPGVIVFDNDDTLVHTSTPVSGVLAELFAAALDVPADEARRQILEGYSLAQDCYGHMARLHGKDAAWAAGMRAVVHKDLFARLEHILSPNPRLLAQIGRVCERGHVVGVLTAASRDYAHRVLEVIRLRDRLHPELLMTRDCVGGHYKDRPEPYLAFLGRSARIAPGRWHIMVEDNVGNLKAAAELGFTTVLVGAPSSEAFVHARYPNVESFLDALLAGEFRPAYAGAPADMPHEARSG